MSGCQRFSRFEPERRTPRRQGRQGGRRRWMIEDRRWSRKAARLDLSEAGGAHHRGHLLPADEGVDGLGEVLVGARLVAANEGGRAGEDLPEVKVVQAPEVGVGGEGELED